MRLFVMILLASVLIGPCILPAPAMGQAQDFINQGKILIFDKQYDQAFELFEQFIKRFPRSHLIPQAYFLKARCLQLQGKNLEAIPAFGEFLDKYPNEPIWAEEAGKDMVESAASLFERKNTAFRNEIIKALTSPNKDVRYFAAIRCATLKDDYLTSMIIPILKEIVRNESEPDIVERAKIKLMALDRRALAEEMESRRERESPESSEVKMFHIEVWTEGKEDPSIELNVPVAFAQLVLRALDESTKQEMARNGYDIDTILKTIRDMGPTDILKIQEGGNLIKIWIK
jgi:tetratricopeptide (TPR) repeat protein